MAYKSCIHVEEFKKRKNCIRNLTKMHENFILASNRLAKKNKNQIPIKCFDCNMHATRLHICLSCVYIGCYNKNHHIHKHIQNTAHILAMDAEYGIIYCSKCNDYIYDPLNEQILLKAYINLGNSIDSLSLFFPWIPNQKELNLLNNFCCNNDPNESIINTNTSQTTYNNIKKRKYTSEYKMNLPLVNFDHSTFNSSSLGKIIICRFGITNIDLYL
ncbi:unnamed protein product [Gordionus sp. m RMFG-2023]